MRNRIVVLISLLLLYSVAWGQGQSSTPATTPSANQQSMPGMGMSGGSGHDTSKMQGKDMSAGTDKDESDDSGM